MNNDSVLIVYDYGARYYDASIARFTTVDELADQAPDWTPFRYGFNNPLLYIDPDGLFETRDDAKEYAKNNDIKTGFFRSSHIVKQHDGTYAIENRRETSSISDYGGDLGVLKGSLITDKDVMNLRVEGEKNFLTGGNEHYVKTLRDESEVNAGPTVMGGAGPDIGKGNIFKALRSLQGLEIGSAITFKNAIGRLKSGNDVFSSTKELAKKLMKKASGGGKVVKDKAHIKGGPNRRDHFHDAERALDSHSFYGPPKN